jgi:membrane protease YdiL (CAAX protease family)
MSHQGRSHRSAGQERGDSKEGRAVLALLAPRGGRTGRSPLGFLVLVFALSVPIWLVEPRDWPVTASVGVPFVAAMILVYGEEGLAGVGRLLRRVFDHERIEPKTWYLPTIFLLPAIFLLTFGVTRLMGLPLPDNPYVPILQMPLLYVLFFVLGAGEEVGWTGYATDPMQERWGALTTGVILGSVGAAWHLVPLIQMGRTPTWIAWWALGSVALRILTVWLYNNTGRSLFAAIMSHAMFNLCFSLFPNYGSHWDPAVAGAIIVIAAALATFLWGPKTLSRFRYGSRRA